LRTIRGRLARKRLVAGGFEAALVLDNTGSMADSGKITALKTATNNLLTQLKNPVVNNGDVSIIPLSRTSMSIRSITINCGSIEPNAGHLQQFQIL
jgi:hypothetical protein